MTAEIRVPSLGESVTEVTVARWIKKVGDAVKQDEALVELETDKVTQEIYATTSGVLLEIAVPEGATAEVGALLGSLGDAGAAAAPKPAAVPAAAPVAPAAAPAPATATSDALARSGPAARKLAEEKGVDAAALSASGKDGRVTKGDVLAAKAAPAVAPAAAPAIAPAVAPAPAPVISAPASIPSAAGREQRVKMTRLRKRIAERLKDAQNTAAILTTFNEVDMTHILAMREQFKDGFEKKHGVKLGFMSFFVKAAIAGLKEIPAVNASIEGEELVYKNYYDIGVAVGTESGLVVPVVRDADQMSFAQIEKKIGEFGKKARDGKLTLDELSGGTFTVSNGGVYGSLLSTPILNPPQSAILGMHKTQKRPVAIGDKIEIRPMMYLAVSYDHRVIDGREAVTFLVRIKEGLEDPQRLLLDL
jgi:2-oxoglutarate dehydrogenase E2 component (dihydrolipoamide succinyltransferase)